MATGLCKSVLGTGVTGLMWKPIWWVAVPTTEFLRGSVVSLKARSDLARLTPLPSDNGWDVRKFGLLLPLLSVSLLSRKVSSCLGSAWLQVERESQNISSERETGSQDWMEETLGLLFLLYISAFLNNFSYKEKKPHHTELELRRALRILEDSSQNKIRHALQV